MSEACYSDPRGSRAEVGYFTEETMPRRTCDAHTYVRYCTTGNGIAGPYCPEKDVASKSVLYVERHFDYGVAVADSAYTVNSYCTVHSAADKSAHPEWYTSEDDTTEAPPDETTDDAVTTEEAVTPPDDHTEDDTEDASDVENDPGGDAEPDTPSD